MADDSADGVVRCKFPGSAKSYYVHCPLAYNGAHVYRRGWSGPAEVVGPAGALYRGAAKDAVIVDPSWSKQAMNKEFDAHARLNASLAESATLSAVDRALQAFRPSTTARRWTSPGRDEYTDGYATISGPVLAALHAPNQENTTMKQSYKCPRHLLDNPVPDNDALIEQHQEAIDAIKASKKAAKKAEKLERKLQREAKEAAATRKRRRELALATLEAMLADEYVDVGKVAAAEKLYELA